ncbi:hypothetical protein EB73_14765 [Mycobacterium sp. SWH-M3]|nr:hypothetical protein EB73_14765 [Mycobacterium sp. SWH-M3]
MLYSERAHSEHRLCVSPLFGAQMENYMRKLSGRRTAGAAATTLTACSLFAAATLPAAAMTVTFVRHGESEGNASGVIDTGTPGPHLTTKGQGEAVAVADQLCPSAPCTAYDGIYASTMIRTQETAQPLSEKMGQPVIVVGEFDPDNPGKNVGVQEIGAGIFEGSPEGAGLGRIGYIVAPLAWTLGLRFVRIPGGEDGNEFDERVDNALAEMADDGSEKPVVFSHGATIMFWTMMNVDNPDLTLILTHPLSNTDVVVVESNDEGGWTLKSWDGQEVAPANYPTQMFVNVRDLIVAPQTAAYKLRQPALALDAQGIGEGVATGASDVAQAGVKFVKDSVTDTVDAIRNIPASLNQPATSRVSTLDSDSETPAADVAESASEAITKPVRKTTGATKLTDGNKATPGRPLSTVRQQVRGAIKDTQTGIESSVKQVGEAVKKLTGADKAGKADAGGNTSDDTGSKDAA